MDPNAASAPGLISSLEAMIQASVTSLLDRRLEAMIQALVTSTLDVKIETAVAAAVRSLGNRMTLIEQRLENAVSTLNHRVDTSATAAVDRRFGPAGSALTAQITFTPTPCSAMPPVSKEAHVLGEVDGTKEDNRICLAKEERAGPQPMGNDGSQKQEEPTRRQSVVESKASEAASLNLIDETSVPMATPERSNEPTSKETDKGHSCAMKSAVYSISTDRASKSRADACSAHTAKLNALTEESSRSANKNSAKRKTNQRDDADQADDMDEAESLSSEEESSHEKPKRKRPKVKIDAPGYTDGPTIRFRRVSPKLTACAKSRGYPRVIDLRSFTEASNKQNLTMADVVATVLFNHDPLSLYAFIDTDDYPIFRFARRESDRKAKSFIIERRREAYGVVVKCGYHLSQVDRAKYRSDASRIWETKYEYIILPVGRWVASNYMQDPIISNSSKRTIEQWATEFGTKILLEKVWVEGPEAKIESDKVVLP